MKNIIIFFVLALSVFIVAISLPVVKYTPVQPGNPATTKTNLDFYSTIIDPPFRDALLNWIEYTYSVKQPNYTITVRKDSFEYKQDMVNFMVEFLVDIKGQGVDTTNRILGKTRGDSKAITALYALCPDQSLLQGKTPCKQMEQL